MRRVLLVSLVLLWGGPRAAAMEWPVLAGGLSGDFRMRSLAGAPPIQWRVEASDQSATENRLLLSARAGGLEVHAVVEMPTDGSRGSWKILEGRVDVSPWWPYLADSGLMGEMPADLKASGEIQLAGAGILEGLQPRGEITITLVGGSIGSVAQKWAVPNLEMTGQVKLTDGEPVIDSLSMTAARVEVQGFILENLQVNAVGESPHHLRVLKVEVAMLGGRVGVRPFTFDLKQPDILATAELEGVALRELAALVPKALSEGEGRLSGALEIGWSATMGVQPGLGSLRVTHDSPTTLRLAVTPDFLTQHLPKKIEWVPTVFGPLSRWLALDNPAYETLRKIEMGEMALTIDSLEVALYPDGPGGAVSARVAVVARPTEGSIVEKVSFEINVFGPLKEVLMLSADERVNFGMKAK